MISIENIQNLFAQQQYNQAKNLVCQFLTHQPQNPTALEILGCIYFYENDFYNAKKFLKQAIKFNPQADQSYLFLGKCYQFLKQPAQIVTAKNFYEIALNLNPQNLTAANLLFGVLTQMGLSETAVKIMNKYFDGEQNELKRCNANIVFSNYCANVKIHDMQRIAKEFSAVISKYCKPLENFKYANLSAKHKQKLKQLKKLNIGIVYPFASATSANTFLCSVLRGLKKINAAFDFYLYYFSGVDEFNKHLNIPNFFVSQKQIITPNLSYEEIVSEIRNDDIHILLDLAGHTSHARIAMYAYRAAPVQITWIGYLATTGIPGMDYFCADPFSVPNKYSEQQFSEQVLYFPHVWECYLPPADILQAFKSRLFDENKKTMIFGNFNTPDKITPQTLDLWAKVLNAVPNSHLIYMRISLQDPSLREYYLQELAKRGVADLSRIHLIANLTREEYLNAYNLVDFVLDAFPCSGMASVADALAIGVPVLTLIGERMPSRLAGSCLKAVGLDNWICQSPEEFVEKAKYFSAPEQQKYLNDLHNNLREKTLKSPLCDAELFAKNFEIKMWEVWNKFLEE